MMSRMATLPWSGASARLSREGRDTLWLLAALTLSMAPHLTRLPLWCAVGCAAHGPHAAGYLAREAMHLAKEARGAAPEESKKLLALAAAVEEVARTCRT